MIKWLRIAIFTSLFCSFSLLALTLDEAKTNGLVGETLSGYLAVVQANNSEATKLVADINVQRTVKYSEIAQKNNLKTKDVASIAGQKLVTRASAGEYVRGINGQWMKKK